MSDLPKTSNWVYQWKVNFKNSKTKSSFSSFQPRFYHSKNFPETLQDG